MGKIRLIFIAILVVSIVPVIYCGDAPDLLKPDSFYGAVGNGFIGIDGGMNRIWTNGYEIEATVGYRITKNIGIETGGIMAFTSMAESLKRTVPVVNSYGVEDTRSTWGGLFMAFPLGISYKWQVPGTYCVLSAGGGGNFAFESETGLDNIDGYTPRGTMGFGYYVETGVYFCDGTPGDDIFRYAIKFRLMENSAGVKDFSTDAFNDPSRSTADDMRYMIIFDIGSL
jgi:hypothetical protein